MRTFFHTSTPYFKSGRLAVSACRKAFCLVLLMDLGAFAQAQGTDVHVYEIVLGPASTEPDTKPVLSTLLNTFPGSRIEFLREPTHLLIVHPNPLSSGHVGAALETAGMRLIAIQDTTAGPINLPSNEPFPVYPDTGDPDLDAATYNAEKTRWVEHYPEAYELLILSAPCDTP